MSLQRVGTPGITGYVAIVALAAACGQVPSGPTDGVGGAAGVGEARQGLTSAQVCVNLVRQGASGTIFDALIVPANQKEPATLGASQVFSTGLYLKDGLERRVLVAFDLSSIPSGPNTNILSADLFLWRGPAGITGPSSIEVHRVLAPWSEATVTWESFDAAFDPSISTSFSNAAQPAVADVRALIAGWVHGVYPNDGLLMEDSGGPISNFWSSNYTQVNLRPHLDICYDVTCDAGMVDCNADGTDGCETNITGVADCGGCGNACPALGVSCVNAAPTCTGGACGFACDSTYADCDGDSGNCCEANTAVNINHCGACNHACPSGAVCDDGTCTCPMGTFACAGECSNYESDPDNCGWCGHVCSGTQVCVAGSCTTTCASGSTLCSDACVDLGSDRNNCGACGNVCGPEELCAGGACFVQPDTVGCADGTREAFTNMAVYPDVAACSGGWTVPGIYPAPPRSGNASCADTGNSSTVNVAGAGCSAADLCATGWHICHAGELAPRAPAGCAATSFPANTFYAASVSGTGCGVCALLSGTVTTGCTYANCLHDCHEAPTLTNDFFGCGTTGAASSYCAEFDRFSHNDCSSLPSPWACSGSYTESLSATKGGAGSGGVLCCR